MRYMVGISDLQHGLLHAMNGRNGQFYVVLAGEIPAPACGCCEGLMELVDQ
ncbi:hypothetical protein [uncultured Ferrovibrio sp.]|uniref:hypothetical protein n=1 Tax=uncultured Ferrovibrio sp. TaxID=1576913 RepID=UPI00262845EB|nr:hypothetical protein [uncultured Ferrovibrio sp.]